MLGTQFAIKKVSDTLEMLSLTFFHQAGVQIKNACQDSNFYKPLIVIDAYSCPVEIPFPRL